MSRLEYAPKLKEIEITDIKKGIGVFTPRPEALVSFEALKATLKKAGYKLDSAEIVILGTIRKDDKGWWIVADNSGQHFALEEAKAEKLLSEAATDSRAEVTGDWKNVGTGAAAHEIVTPSALNKIESAPKVAAAKIVYVKEVPVVAFIPASYVVPPVNELSESTTSPAAPSQPRPLAPIRTTSPGLTVYKGGAITPRLYLIKQHLGNLEVNRQLLDVSVSYTPTPRVQLEAEVPVSHTSFGDDTTSGSGVGLGNITLWTKYRFFRTLKTYGDRQAAVRFGLELPTGDNDAPPLQDINAPAFVRQQLTPINGGWSPHFDLAFSQAGGRFIFGGNVEGILRSERDGFRIGHEVRINTDLEYVLLPRNYQAPGKELFVILESTFVHRGLGRLNGEVVEESKSTEFYLAPGLQFAADPRFVIEGSVQIPVVQNNGSLVLITNVNVLLGVKYLF